MKLYHATVRRRLVLLLLLLVLLLMLLLMLNSLRLGRWSICHRFELEAGVEFLQFRYFRVFILFASSLTPLPSQSRHSFRMKMTHRRRAASLMSTSGRGRRRRRRRRLRELRRGGRRSLR